MWTRARWALGLGVLLTAGSAAQADTVRPVPVFVNGGRLESDAFMLRDVGRTVLPMRVLFESLGARVEWDRAQQAVYAWMPDGIGVRLGLGERAAQSLRMSEQPGPGNWGRVTGSRRLDAPAMLVSGRVFVPLRFASEALSADVRYSGRRPAVFIHTRTAAGGGVDEPPVARRPREREVDVDPPVTRRPRDREPNAEPPVVRRPRPRDVEPDPARIAAALDVSLAVDDARLAQGDEMVARLQVRNAGNRAVEVPFRSGQKFDIEVLQEERLVWNWAHDRAYTQALTSLSLKPGEVVTFTVRWKLEDNRGRQVPAGRYLVRGTLTPAFREPQLTAEEQVVVTE